MRTVLRRPFDPVLQQLLAGTAPKTLKEVLARPHTDQEVANVLLRRDPIPQITRDDRWPTLTRSLDTHLRTLEERRELYLPNMAEFTNAAIVSDYCGGHPGSKYDTYSMLIAAWDVVYHMHEGYARLRKECSFDRTMCFKKLNDGMRRRILDRWLKLVDGLPGLLFTLIVDRSVTSVLYANDIETVQKSVDALKAAGLGIWSLKSAERLVRILHPIGYLCAVMLKPTQGLFWMTDRDDITPNEPLSKATCELFGRTLNLYQPASYARIGFVPAPFDANDPDGQRFNDMLSIPDLAAGAIESLVTQRDMPNPSVKETTNTIGAWLSRQSIGLKKLNMLVKPGKDNISTAIVSFDSKEPLPIDAITVYV